MRLTDAQEHAAAFREMCATEMLEKKQRSPPPGWLRNAGVASSEAEHARASSHLFSNADEDAWELWMAAAATVAIKDGKDARETAETPGDADADVDADVDVDETAGEALDWSTAARICQAAAEGALIGAPTASHGRVILRTVAPRPQRPQRPQQQTGLQPPKSASAAATAAVAGEPSTQPSNAFHAWQPRSRLALFALAADMLGAVPFQCLILESSADAVSSSAAPLGGTVQDMLSAAGRWDDARRWARAAGRLVNRADTDADARRGCDVDACDVHAVTEAQAAALLAGRAADFDGHVLF